MVESAQQESSHIPVNEREQAALAYAERGWEVLPLEPRGKEPRTPHGFYDATTNPDQVRAWFRANPDYNVGIRTGHGLIVLDADSPEADEYLSAFGATRTVRTGKGRHFYYQSSRNFKSSQGTLREMVDVRSEEGYIVAPPSVHASGTVYGWEDESVPLSPLPDGLVDALDALQRRPTSSDATISKEDEIIPEGRRHKEFPKVAGKLVERMAGFSVNQVKAVVRSENERRCRPPLAQREVDSMTEAFFDNDAAKRPRRSFRLLSRKELSTQPDPEYLIEGVLQKNSLALLYGDPGSAKTFLALDMSIRVATGSPWCGQEVSPASVVYVCAEGAVGIKRRTEANEFRNVVSADKLWVVDAAVQLHEPTHVNEFIAVLQENEVRPGFIVFDTLARCAVGVDENSAMDMGLVIAGLERIKREFDATVLVVHHSTKSNAKTIRGSSALEGGVDTAFALAENEIHERILTNVRQKEGELAETLRFRLQPVPECGSAILTFEGKASWQPSVSESEETALDTLRDLGSADFTTWMEASGLTKTTFNRSRRRLVKTGQVVGSDKEYRVTSTGGLQLAA